MDTKAKNLIPYLVYLVGLLALLFVVHEPKIESLNASPSQATPSHQAMQAPAAERVP